MEHQEPLPKPQLAEVGIEHGVSLPAIFKIAITVAVEARFEAAAWAGVAAALAGFAAALAAGFFAAPLFLIRLANISAMLPRVEVFPAVVFAFFICCLVVFVVLVSFRFSANTAG
jgi:hypothetical protein